MSDLSGPPFRADHVGSLSQPAELPRARGERRAKRDLYLPPTPAKAGAHVGDGSRPVPGRREMKEDRNDRSPETAVPR
jgi:hypothetical protein